MIFKKQERKLFLLFVFLFLSHCGLGIGEKSPPIPKYDPFANAGDCLKLDYEEEFSSYFLEEQDKGQKDNSNGERLRKALNCIGSTVTKAKDLIDHEHLEKQELVNLLNNKFIKTKNMERIINHITRTAYFDNYLFIKDTVIHLIGEKQEGRFVKTDEICKVQNDKIVLSKQEVDVFLNFLKNLSEFFLIIDKASYEVFEGFFKSNNLLLKSQLEESIVFKDDFVSFLSSYLSKDFPGYSKFINEHLVLHDKFDKEKFHFYSSNDWVKFNQKRETYLKILQKRYKALQPIFDMARLHSSSSDVLTVQNVKYMMLNIYIMKTLFSVYDTNQDFILNSQELESLSCLMTPLISNILLPTLKGERKFIQDMYSSKTIASYILNYQKIPGKADVSYFTYSLLLPEDLEPLSYPEVSRLISVLFSALFDNVNLYLQKEPSP